MVHGVADALQVRYLRMKNVRDKNKAKVERWRGGKSALSYGYLSGRMCPMSVGRYSSRITTVFCCFFQEKINGDASVGNVVVRIGPEECSELC